MRFFKVRSTKTRPYNSPINRPNIIFKLSGPCNKSGWTNEGDTFNPFLHPKFAHSLSTLLMRWRVHFFRSILLSQPRRKKTPKQCTTEWQRNTRPHCLNRLESMKSQRRLYRWLEFGIIQWEAVILCHEFSLKWYRELCHLCFFTVFLLCMCVTSTFAGGYSQNISVYLLVFGVVFFLCMSVCVWRESSSLWFRSTCKQRHREFSVANLLRNGF